MKRGICKLCLHEKDLREGHYLPRSVYKSNRARALKSQNPVALGSKQRQDQGQVTDYVFCADCEQLFSRNGESWVLDRIPHDYGKPFRLQDALERETPFYIRPGLNLYAGGTISAFDMDKLVYFAASIFWRGAAHGWRSGRGERTPEVDLGDHAEALRKFLLGQGPFPSDVWLTAMIWPFKKVLNAGIVPRQEHAGGWNRYWFYVSGLGFILHFGGAVPTEIKQRCSQNTGQRAITVEVDFGNAVYEFVRGKVGDADSPEMRVMLEEIRQVGTEADAGVCFPERIGLKPGVPDREPRR
jgi:hypothetical protein